MRPSSCRRGAGESRHADAKATVQSEVRDVAVAGRRRGRSAQSRLDVVAAQAGREVRRGDRHRRAELVIAVDGAAGDERVRVAAAEPHPVVLSLETQSEGHQRQGQASVRAEVEPGVVDVAEITDGNGRAGRKPEGKRELCARWRCKEHRAATAVRRVLFKLASRESVELKLLFRRQNIADPRPVSRDMQRRTGAPE